MIVVFETHPVQYKAPLYRALARHDPDFLVVYGTDVSVRAHHDREFGQVVDWNRDLLEGYTCELLDCLRGDDLGGWRSLSGAGVRGVLEKYSPVGSVITSLRYVFDFTALRESRRRCPQVWLRAETQDEAFVRPAWKTMVRGMIYRRLYAQFDGAFCFGELNRKHLLRHGFRPESLHRVVYAVPDPVGGLAHAEKADLRRRERQQLGIGEDAFVLGFCGKLFAKKDPGLLLRGWEALPSALRGRVTLLFVGAGEDREALETRAREMGCRAVFTGFADQQRLPGLYLAMDALALPSRRMGETWGLVVNEALHAGCGIIMSEAVGCYAEFGGWERVRVIPIGDAAAMARAIEELAGYPRAFDWCAAAMDDYSLEKQAERLAEGFARIRREARK